MSCKCMRQHSTIMHAAVTVRWLLEFTSQQHLGTLYSSGISSHVQYLQISPGSYPTAPLCSLILHITVTLLTLTFLKEFLLISIKCFSLIRMETQLLIPCTHKDTSFSGNTGCRRDTRLASELIFGRG